MEKRVFQSLGRGVCLSRKKCPSLREDQSQRPNPKVCLAYLKKNKATGAVGYQAGESNQIGCQCNQGPSHLRQDKTFEFYLKCYGISLKGFDQRCV